ncbi:MAG: exonuclease SbcCD subunit D, partial [Aquificaceae bacterium]
RDRSYAEKIAQYLKALAVEVEKRPYGILLAHLALDKAILSGSELPSSVLPRYMVRADTIPDAFKYVALGHIHKHQRIEAVAQVYYSGSLYQIDFSEVKDIKKYANLLLLEGGLVKVRPIELTLKRRLVELELSDKIEVLEELAGEEVLVKVRLRVNMGDPYFNLKRERIERLLGEKLAKLEIEPVETKGVMGIKEDRLSLFELYVDFYRSEYKGEPSEDLKKLLRELIDKVSHEAN